MTNEYVITIDQYIEDDIRGTAKVLQAGVERLLRADLDRNAKMETMDLMAKIAEAGANRLHSHLARQIEVTHHEDEPANG